MSDDRRFALYFSHGWRPREVDLNVTVWNALDECCELLVDAPDEPGADPPYYINRIEERLRRCDLFVSVLSYRDPDPGTFSGPDAKLRCSPFSLFEIRLAERADIPRLILYERSTVFRPPKVQRAWEAYVPFDRGARDDMPEQAQWRKVVEPRIRKWLDWTNEHRKPSSYEQSTGAVILLDRKTHGPLGELLETCLRDNGFDPAYCDADEARSSDALRQLRETGLVAVEFGGASIRQQQLYAAAHSLSIPAVRLLSGGESAALPWILEGDPGGYQRDLVRWSNLDEVRALVEPRVKAMFTVSPALAGEKAIDYLQSKRYARFFVFLSHTLKPPHRTLVEKVSARLTERHVKPFEYHQVNTAGIDWKAVLGQALERTTHFVVLLSDGYEQSPTCTYELEQVLARGSAVTLLPFMIGGRSVPHPKLGHMHNTLLSGADVETNAGTIVEQVMQSLEQSVRASQRPA